MPKVIVYSTQTCPFCTMVKDFLKQNKVAFEDIDVSSNHDALRAMVAKSGSTGVPQIEINGKVIVGFNEAALRQALGI